MYAVHPGRTCRNRLGYGHPPPWIQTVQLIWLLVGYILLRVGHTPLTWPWRLGWMLWPRVVGLAQERNASFVVVVVVVVVVIAVAVIVFSYGGGVWWWWWWWE